MPNKTLARPRTPGGISDKIQLNPSTQGGPFQHAHGRQRRRLVLHSIEWVFNTVLAGLKTLT
jgi:hypothetical protein